MKLIDLARHYSDLFDGLTPSIWVISAVAHIQYEDVVSGEIESNGAIEKEVRDRSARYVGGEPLQYVIGSWPFGSLELKCDRRALIPRPETEYLLEVILDRFLPKLIHSVLDLGTGTGAIGLALGASGRCEEVVLVDYSNDALELARENLELNRELIRASVAFEQGSWYEALSGREFERFDMIVSNPPYIATSELDLLDPRVRMEPHLALDGGGTGMVEIETIVAGAPQFLAPDGILILEIGESQGELACSLANRAGFRSVRIERDLVGKDRYLIAS
ncbi:MULTISPECIES: peptide chain release factor N(5)-glutamine methyltransferase [Acidithrix]|uniref:peptide chain release factor N(5)-glutamine methyltransferase n=1 Tax=Acidithrix ferrooxidans TaxID=1280514 RepID=A0A0D8HLR2_9ACTN|nr:MULTISPECIES: peptide chain release factor N(5)-glutamine methyltransferase [Acidithrix]KJF18036.1 release factor glutamine methyltransferase [Acidithrix ferrooxidans]CAG4918612.1 unnamed protein product [Acidithrix sp. C25]